MVDRADRLGVQLGASARHLVEGQLRPGRDDEIVIGEPGAVFQHQCVARGVERVDPLGDELDALLFQVGPDRERDRLAFAPTHGQPGVRGHELEIVLRVDDGHLVRTPQRGSQLVGGGHAADAGAHDDDVGHGRCLLG
jgi:hypothetical protein